MVSSTSPTSSHIRVAHELGVKYFEVRSWPNSVDYDQAAGQPRPAQAVNSIGIRTIGQHRQVARRSGPSGKYVAQCAIEQTVQR